MSFSAAAYSDPRRSLTHADVNRLAPHMNILGLTSLPPDEQTVQRAYKQALRQNPGRVDALRLAANVMATEESRREFLRTAPMMPAPTLSLGVRKANHQITASCKVATQGSGCPPCAVASSRGCRPTMEDAHIAGEPVGHMGHVFAVLDGHGGMRAAKLLSHQIPSTLAKHGADEGRLSKASATAAFAELDERILGHTWEDGSCACVAVLSKEENGKRPTLQLLQLGDCNALLFRYTHSTEGFLAVAGDGQPLCTNHRPTEPSEATRLRAANAPVSATGRLAGLAVSRAFGDREHKRTLSRGHLLAEPEVIGPVELPADAGILLIACDGLFDHLEPVQCCAVLNKFCKQAGGAGVRSDLAKAASALVQAALDEGSLDNVSVVLVDVAAP